MLDFLAGRKRKTGRKQSGNRERVHKNMMKDDILLQQIDEFKEKAKQLQSLIETKENQVMELQDVVDERAEAAEQLDAEIAQKQETSDELTASFEKQIQEMIALIDSKMDEISDKTQETIENAAEELAGTSDHMSEVTEQMKANKNDLSEKIHTETVKSYRNMQVCIGELEDKIDELSEKLAQKKSGRGLMAASLVISIIALAGIACVLVQQCGITLIQF